jgi:hypothetical protein
MDEALRRRINDPKIRQCVRDADFQIWVKANPPPSLQALVAQYGTYSGIPGEAWAQFDAAVAQWQLARKHRLI